MQRVRFYVFLFLAWSGAISIPSWAQKNYNTVNVRTGDKTQLSDDNEAVLGFDFSNINKQFHYRDPSALRRISEAENRVKMATDADDRERYLRKLKPLLEDYIKNWGIRNYYLETPLLWKLGQVYEQLGEMAKAKVMYRLTLKHTRAEVKQIASHYARIYDSLTTNTREYYIPIKHYYELVNYRRSVDTIRPPQSVYTNMGEGINSSASDYGPALSAKNDTLIFSSVRKKRKNNGRADEDLYMSRYEYEVWYDAEPLESLNTPYNEGSACMSKDGKRLFFSRCNSPQGYGDCDLFSADWDDFTKRWTNVRNLGPNVNGIAWESQPCLSHTEDTLFFSSNRLGGFGQADIWMSVKERDGSWGPARNPGPVINTRFNEVSPFIHPEFNVLYFSSDGHMLNFGGAEISKGVYRPYYEMIRYFEQKGPKEYLVERPEHVKNTFDIFKSYLRDGHFLEPKNVGPLVNGVGDEYYFTIDRKSQKLYYARSEDSLNKNLDLYSFPLPMEAQPGATTVFRGSLTDSAGKPYKFGIVSIIDLDNGIEVAPRALRPDGSFDFELIRNNNYLLVIQGDEFFRIQEFFRLSGDTTVVKKGQSVNRNTKITFQSIEFEENSAEILPSMFEDLEHLMNFLIDNPEFKLRIAGHTDQKGNKKENLRLSQDRADAIKKYITEGGQIKPRRVEATGFGATKPIVPVERTEKDRRINRRVEFELYMGTP